MNQSRLIEEGSNERRDLVGFRPRRCFSKTQSIDFRVQRSQTVSAAPRRHFIFTRRQFRQAISLYISEFVCSASLEGWGNHLKPLAVDLLIVTRNAILP